ncbi:MAG: hypothetical protein ACTFAK_16265 [Candidatus Electronema sp. VV]|uniref:hypothetical protein n=1 Tax=Candidatus Electronema sp. V4 TaxID=3454756 RepID=UPI0040556D57
MASILNPTLTIEEHTESTVKARVKYMVAQFPPEYWAGTVYYEEIHLIGDDQPFNPAEPSGSDIVVAAFTPQYIVNPYTGIPPRFYFERERVLIIGRCALDEDPGFTMHGLPKPDEIFARITLKYAANVPYPIATLPPSSWPVTAATAQSNTVTGSWC